MNKRLNNYAVVLGTLGLVFALCACGETKENNIIQQTLEPVASVEQVETTGEEGNTEELYPTGAKKAEGTEPFELMNDEGSTISVYPNENGELSFDVSLYRITTFENGNGVEMDGGFYVFEMYADEDCKLSCQLNPEADGSYTLEIVDSQWDIVPSGESFGNFVKQ